MNTQTYEIRNKNQSLLSKYKKELIKKSTKSELIFKNRLDKIGLKYIFQKGFLAGKTFVIADFYIPEKKLVIEIDGSIHYLKYVAFRDKLKDEYYKTRRFNVIRIKNENVESFDLNEIINIKTRPSKF